MPGSDVTGGRIGGLTTLFALNGFGYACMVSRLPAMRDQLQVSTATAGTMLVGLGAGAVLNLPIAGRLCRRFGSSRTASIGVAVGSIGFAALAWSLHSRSVVAAVLSLVVCGAGASLWDVSMNVGASSTEQRRGQPLMPRLHGCFSVGTILGAAVGAGCAGLGVSVVSQLVVLATATLVVGGVAAYRCDNDVEPDADAIGATWRDPHTVRLGVVVLAFALAEGVANDWLALAMRDVHDVSETVAAASFALFVSAMALGRLSGSAALGRFDAGHLLRSSAIAIAVGVPVVSFAPSPAIAAIGVVLWGLGAALGFPIVLSEAGRATSDPAARVATVSAIGYTAFLAGPPLIGLIVHRFGLEVALLIPALLAVAVRGLITRAVGTPVTPHDVTYSPHQATAQTPST